MGRLPGVQVKCAVTALLFHPLPFGRGARVTMMAGGPDGAIVNGSLVTDALFPATSVAVPETVWFAPTVAITWSGGQLATPDSESEHVKRAVTGPV